MTPLALRFLWPNFRRDWRSGELGILLLALVIGVASVATTGFLSDRFNRLLSERSGEFLGADVLLTSPAPVPDSLLMVGEKNPGNQAAEQGNPPLRSDAIDFTSMIAVGDAFQMASVRAIDADYPLRGQVMLSLTREENAHAARAQPPRDSVYVDAQLLNLLPVKVGSHIAIGDADFVIAGLVRDEPGRAGSAMFGLAPRIFMHTEDVAKTHIIAPGSRVNYLYYFAGNSEEMAGFEARLRPQISTSQKLIGGREGGASLGAAFTRSERFFSLSSLVSLLLSALAIGLAARRYAQRHLNSAALLRCLGASGGAVSRIFAMQLLSLGVLGCLLGVALGALAQSLMLRALAPDLWAQLPALSWRPAWVASASGLLVLLACAWPSILRLSRVPPLRILRRDVLPIPASLLLVYGVSGLLFFLLCYWYAGNISLLLSMTAGVVILMSVLWLMARGLLMLSPLLRRRTRGAWRFGLAQLVKHSNAATVQLGAFSMALFLMLSVALIRTDLLNAWREQLPVDAPNHFLINIAPQEVAAIKRYFDTAKMPLTPMFAMVRGRLQSKNDRPIAQVVPKNASDDNSLSRELNLTWSAQLPDNNIIVAGKWHGDNKNAGISVENELAERLQLKLGDRLRFSIGDREVSAPITSLRKVQWQTMQPNFFVIFSPGILEDLPSMWMTAVRVEPSEQTQLAQFVHQFPTVTIIAVDKIMHDVQAVITQVVLAIECLLLFLLLAGIAVLLAAVLASIDERRREAVLLRALGAQNRFLLRSLLIEFGVIGVVAGLLAGAGVEAFSAAIGQSLFELPWQPHLWVWLVAPGAGCMLVGGFAWLALRHIVHLPPMMVLRED